MLCSKFKQIVLPRQAPNINVQFRYLITSRYLFKRWIWYDGFLANVCKKEIGSMSVLRFILRDFRVWSAWTRSNLVSTVVKRCRRDRSVREVIQCFKQTFRPRRTLLLSATAAYKAREDDEDDDTPVKCDRNITDEELQALLLELEGVETLSRNTLFCNGCGRRLVIEKKQPGVPYCLCKVAETPAESPDGWVPYMEAEDVIIWRKEYKSGLGLYAYKVYGRYPDVRAIDFAAVQVDSSYRTVWDAAVAALAVVEHRVSGLADQAVLHWEVMWPRLFANRDYVYIRRHKEFDVTTRSLPHKDGLFRTPPPCEVRTEPIYTERPSVHSKAKRKAMEAYERERDGPPADNKVYVIISRSCEHPKVPETKHAIRVSEYWSHMVVKTLEGPDKMGMEFVLTYYDEPAVGGMPSTVAAWATGRAAPAYLQRMRRAACDYRAWRLATHQQDLPEFTPFVRGSEHSAEDTPVVDSEQDIESSQTDPGMERSDSLRDQSTQTEVTATSPEQPEVKVTQVTSKVTEDKAVEAKVEETQSEKHNATTETETTKGDEEEPKAGGWWRYLYPFYYFV